MALSSTCSPLYYGCHCSAHPSLFATEPWRYGWFCDGQHNTISFFRVKAKPSGQTACEQRKHTNSTRRKRTVSLEMPAVERGEKESMRSAPPPLPFMLGCEIRLDLNNGPFLFDLQRISSWRLTMNSNANGSRGIIVRSPEEKVQPKPTFLSCFYNDTHLY